MDETVQRERSIYTYLKRVFAMEGDRRTEDSEWDIYDKTWS
jgi:hypothetical protein